MRATGLSMRRCCECWIATGKRIGEVGIALRIDQQEEALRLELGNKDGLQRSYGNQALILQAWGRLEEALALLKKKETHTTVGSTPI